MEHLKQTYVVGNRKEIITAGISDYTTFNNGTIAVAGITSDEAVIILRLFPGLLVTAQDSELGAVIEYNKMIAARERAVAAQSETRRFKISGTI